MALKIIVSYDDTDYDRDALALGRLLALGGRRALARLCRPLLRRRARGEGGGGDVGPRRRLGRRAGHAPHVIVNAGTSVGLTEIAERENADVIVFGSEYRTAQARSSRASPPTNCCSVARRQSPSPRPACTPRRRYRSTPSASSTRATPPPVRPPTASLRRSAPASAEYGSGPVDLLVVGSRPEAPAGKVVLSAKSDYAVEAANYPVLVVPRGTSLGFSGAGRLPSGLTTRIMAAISGSRPSIRSPASLE